jgi:hypothetical protein
MSNTNTIVDSTTVDGIDVSNMNDAAIFARITSMKKEVKDLTESGITGAAVTATKNALNGKIERLTSIVNARYETPGQSAE